MTAKAVCAEDKADVVKVWDYSALSAEGGLWAEGAPFLEPPVDAREVPEKTGQHEDALGELGTRVARVNVLVDSHRAEDFQSEKKQC